MRCLRWGLAVSLLVTAGCMGKVCTDVGCSNQFSATIKRGDGSFPTGLHQLDITVDGVSEVCSFTFAGSAVTTSCPGATFVSVGPAETCTEFRQGNAVGFRCDPIPGQFVERVQIAKTPRDLRIVQSADDVVLLDASMTPSYQAVRPNGPECEPVCQQASVTLALQ